jgi:hypothetical protein
MDEVPLEYGTGVPYNTPERFPHHTWGSGEVQFTGEKSILVRVYGERAVPCYSGG